MTRRFALGLALGVAMLAGCQSADSAKEKPTLLPRFFLEAGTDVAGTPLVLPHSGVNIRVNSKPVITEGDVLDAELVQVDLGKCLMFRLTPSALRDFYRLSGSHQGRRLVLVVNDNPLGARRIDGAIADGVIFIFVEMNDELLPEFVAKLKQSAAATQKELRRKG
jgi:hypothetical protein